MNVITASKHRRVKGLVRGFPDLQFFPRAGRPFFIELKSTAKKKPDKAQAELHEYLKSLGYRVYVASSVNDVLVALDIQGVPTKVAA